MRRTGEAWDGHVVMGEWMRAPALLLLAIPPVVTALLWASAALVTIVAAGIVARLLPLPGFLSRATALLASRRAPLFFGLVTALVYWWAWGSLNEPAAVHDEAAYVLQARIFASGSWTAPSPPLPEFFEQMYVLVTPRVASKYPPGHSLLLVPGIWLGLPGLMPVVLLGLAGGLLFAVARRLAGREVALATWVLWLTVPTTGWSAPYFPSYLSQTTSVVMWLGAWWSLLEWRRTERGRWLVLLASCVVWEAITRPFNAIALAVPVGIVVLYTVARRRLWRDLVIASAVGAAILALVPIWSAETTGDWRLTPQLHYAKLYVPSDVPGFGADSSPATRPLPPDLARVAEWLRGIHAEHTVDRLPETVGERLHNISGELWGHWLLGLQLLMLLGLYRAGRPVFVALASCVLLLLVYLDFGHTPGWTVYYLESHLLAAFLAALGVTQLLEFVVSWRYGARGGITPEPRIAMAMLLLLAVDAIPASGALSKRRAEVERAHRYHASFRRVLASTAPERVVVFVRYAPEHDIHRALVEVPPDYATGRAWVVHDRGADNERLLRLAPDRKPYLFDEASWRLLPMREGAAPVQ